jgi:hypothetical protein
VTSTTCTPNVARQQRRGPVDVTGFHKEVREAIDAFGVDVSYAVAMARAAVTITRKRAVWQQRRDEQDG